MDNDYVIVTFNGQLFEKFSMVEKDTSQTHICYTINGIWATREEWMQKKQEAIAQDSVKVHSKS